MDYTAEAQGAQDLGALETAMLNTSRIAQSGLKLIDPLSTSVQMWTKAGTAIGEYTDHFVIANQAMYWPQTSNDSVEYHKAVESTRTGLVTSHDAITGGSAGGGIPLLLENVGRNIQYAADTVKAIQEYVDKQLAALAIANGPKTGGASKGGGVTSTPSAADQAAAKDAMFKLLKPEVVRAGGTLNSLGTFLRQSGKTLLSASSQLKWVGPGAGAGAPGGVPGAAPGGVPSTAPGGVPGGAPTDAGAPPGQDAGGAEAGAGGETPGAGGEMPGGDTGLAGMPPAAAPAMPPPVKLPTIPGPNLPGMPPPVAIPPIAPLPVRPGTGARGIGRIGGGGPGGIGGGIGGGPVKGDGGLKTGNGFQQIPRAGQQVSATPVPSGGQAPAAPSGLSSGSGAGAGSAGGGMPPMMPPMGGAGAGGGGRNGKGSPLRPVGRRRERRDEDTPGVPVGLRGRAGKDLPGAFPAVPANTRRRQDSGPSAETLQLLDEELWQVDETEAAAPQATPRLTN